MPFSCARATIFFQCGISTSFHCHSRISVTIGGQLVVIQLGVVSCGEPPGQPEVMMIVLMPSSPASLKVFSMTI